MNLGPAGIVGEGSECPALFLPSIPRRGVLEQDTEPLTAPRVPQHCSGCVFTCVCVSVCSLEGLNAEHKF